MDIGTIVGGLPLPSADSIHVGPVRDYVGDRKDST